ncbi:MAG: hypothetical protein ABR548_14355 [Actinomycetota bacterium]|nr:hypothetical protein [Actinomycetota bacterium]
MTDKLEQLSTLDRATLRAWRVANTIGWWIACFVAAGIIRVAERSTLERLADRGSFPTGWQASSLHAIFFLAMAFAVAGIAGSRIWRDQTRVTLITLLVMLGPEVWGGGVWSAIPAAGAIAAGYLWTKHVVGARRV